MYTVEYDAPIGEGKTVKNWYGLHSTEAEAWGWVLRQTNPNMFKVVKAVKNRRTNA